MAKINCFIRNTYVKGTSTKDSSIKSAATSNTCTKTAYSRNVSDKSAYTGVIGLESIWIRDTCTCAGIIFIRAWGASSVSTIKHLGIQS